MRFPSVSVPVLAIGLLAAGAAAGAPPAPAPEDLLATVPSDSSAAAALAGDAAAEAERLLDAGDFEAAARLLRHAFEVRSRFSVPETLEIADQRSLLMYCEFRLGRLEEARAVQEDVLRIHRRLLPPGDPLVADDLADLATLCDRLGDDECAASSWRESVDLLREKDPGDVAAKVAPRWSALAEKERQLGRYAVCEEEMRSVIEYSEANLPRDHQHAKLLNNLGVLYWDQQRYDDAARLLREALRISEADSTTTVSRITVATHNLANLKREQGQWEEAELLHRKALELARAHLTDDPQFPIFLKEAAVLFADEERWEEAFALWDEASRALEAAPQALLESEILYERGRAHLDRGETVEAEAALSRALEIRESVLGPDHPMVGQALVGLAGVGEAEPRLERAVAILDRTSVYPEERAEAHAALARLAWSERRGSDAMTSMNVALEIVEGLRVHRAASEAGRTDWVRRYAAMTQEMMGWLLDLGEIEKAILVGETIRARVLWDQMTAARVDPWADVSPRERPALEQRERSARSRISERRRELAVAVGDDEVRRLQSLLEEAVRDYENVVEEIRSHQKTALLPEPPTLELLDEVRAALDEGEMLLLYHVGVERSHLFEIGPRNYGWSPVRVSRELSEDWGVEPGAVGEAFLESALREAAGGGVAVLSPVRGVGGLQPSAQAVPGEAAERDPARTRDLERLARLLLPAAARDRILAAKRVHLIPDGALHAFPFEALVLSEGPEIVYWLDGGPTISYGHSLATFVELAEREERSAKTGPAVVLTVSNPEFEGEGSAEEASSLAGGGPRWPALPGSERESEAIRRAFPEAEVVQLTGSEARESEVKREAPRARLLHLGTHGIVQRDRSDLLAALVLAREPEGSPEDGYLHLFEVYNLSLDADLVVLSACETKLGRRVRGEGVFALSRGFLAAGARRTVASLWPVSDDATAALVGELFERLGEDPGAVDPARALRDAKLAVRHRKEWADPFYWAPFVISGKF